MIKLFEESMMTQIQWSSFPFNSKNFNPNVTFPPEIIAMSCIGFVFGNLIGPIGVIIGKLFTF